MSSSKLEQLGSLFCCIYIPCRSFRLRRLCSDQFFGFSQGKYFRLKVIFSKREVCPLGEVNACNVCCRPHIFAPILGKSNCFLSGGLIFNEKGEVHADEYKTYYQNGYKTDIANIDI